MTVAKSKKQKEEDKKKADAVTHEGRHQFSDKEKLQLGSDIAEYYMKKATITTELTRVKSEYKAKLDACESKIQKLTEKISNGHEYRDFQCIVEKDFENKSVRYIDVESGKVVEERKMSQHEFQLGIGDKVVNDESDKDAEESEKDKIEKNLKGDGGEAEEDSLAK